MSANNAIFVIPIDWTCPRVYENGRIVEWQTIKQWVVVHSDFDQIGELTHTATVTQELLWLLLMEGAKVFQSQEAAFKEAVEMTGTIAILEYGIQAVPALTYKAPSDKSLY
jgi:hypothetical protein